MSDKKWLEANYSRVKDDTVLLSCLRDNHIENLKFELGVFALGLATFVIMLMLAACTNTGYYICSSSRCTGYYDNTACGLACALLHKS